VTTSLQRLIPSASARFRHTLAAHILVTSFPARCLIHEAHASTSQSDLQFRLRSFALSWARRLVELSTRMGNTVSSIRGRGVPLLLSSRGDRHVSIFPSSLLPSWRLGSAPAVCCAHAEASRFVCSADQPQHGRSFSGDPTLFCSSRSVTQDGQARMEEFPPVHRPGKRIRAPGSKGKAPESADAS